MKKRYSTAVKFLVIENTYTPGLGVVESTRFINASISSEVQVDTFYTELSTNYRSLAISQQEQNVLEGARVRMPYVKQIVEALRGNKEVRIYKYGNENNVFILNSSVDDVKEQHKEIEFQVKKWVRR